MKPVEVVSLALAEFHEEVAYYAAQRPTAGIKLREDVFAALEQISRFPECGRIDPLVHSIRRLVTQRFRFVVHYQILDDRVRVWAVSHPARLPGYWSQRHQR